MTSVLAHRFKQSTEWCRLIPDDQWEIYRSVIDAAATRRLNFALGGAFAVATYTGFWRNTKDIDLYILPEHREGMIEVLNSLGLADFYEQLPYDRAWIYRATKDGTIVDVIWAMANHHSQVDQLWMSGPEIKMRGRRLNVIPAEAMVFDKLYIMQRERCDWPDVLNLLYWTAGDVNWEIILGRLGPDWPLLAGLLSVFRWVSPGRAADVPEWVWQRLQLAPPQTESAGPDIDPRRVSLLDRRPWYGPDRAKLQPAA